jgi:hypothetical protein
MSRPNSAHSNYWKVNFSNIPTVTNVKELEYFHEYVRSITIPDYNIIEEPSPFKGEVIRNPVSRVNEDLAQIQIDFTASEGYFNYFHFLEWMLRIRNNGVGVDTGYLRDYVIKNIFIELLDNTGRKIGQLEYKDARLLSLSSFSLASGQSEEVFFSCNFSYESISLNSFDVE